MAMTEGTYVEAANSIISGVPVGLHAYEEAIVHLSRSGVASNKKHRMTKRRRLARETYAERGLSSRRTFLARYPDSVELYLLDCIFLSCCLE
jgi:hypothetical protein